MMKKLLLIILPVLFFTATLQAQTKTWDFSSNWPETDGFAGYPAAGGTVVVDNLTIVPHTSSDNMGQINASVIDFGDGFVSALRFRTNGSSGGTAELPTSRRYLSFPVSGNVDVTIWCAAGGSSARDLNISDGTSVLGTIVTDGEQDVPKKLTVNYVGGAGTIYISQTNNFSIHKIEVTGVGADVLGVNDVQSSVTTNVRAIGNRLYVSDVKLDTEINIYSMTGALVKSLRTNTNADFSFKSGLYIATVKTSEGQKSVKLLLK
ncbi:T9SS type A sorting domain-containing protein [Flavobacteriaceae bacterium SZ-1-7]|uniref:T9SS type A sorting domain-containing protein n=1 Tax=Tamlana sedimenti TaxID=3134126 RepID=UPI003123A985